MSSNSFKALVVVGALVLISNFSAFAGSNHGQGYSRHNLVSDLPNQAERTDPNLVNPWGIAIGDDTRIWVADNATGKSTIYRGNGLQSSLVVEIPAASGGTATPTGIVYHDIEEGNGANEFIVSAGPNGPSGPSIFIFASEDGVISGWNPGADRTHAIIGASRPGAVYTGLAILQNDVGSTLFAANFPNGVVDVYDSAFTYVSSFTDAGLEGYGPFGIQQIAGQIYVAFAKIGDDGDEEHGAGLGYVDVFNPDGTLVTQLVAQGDLNAPWGMALAPGNFGPFSNDLLVGNFGDGRIHAYDPTSGESKGTMTDHAGRPIEIEGLWGIAFGNGTNDGGLKNTLYFNAGIDDEQHGLFGRLSTRSNPN